MRLIIQLLAGASLLASYSSASQAQWVQFGPGYVQAPFVRVEAYPDGSRHVRAPFVDVYWPPTRQPFIADNDVRPLSWAALSQSIRELSYRLNADLSRFPDGESWKAKLRTAEIANLLPIDRPDPPTELLRQQLLSILTEHRDLTRSSVSGVLNLMSLYRLDAALEEYTLPMEQRLRRQVFAAAGELNRDLRRFGTAASWQEYFLLTPGAMLASDRANGGVLNSEDVKSALLRFDNIQGKAEFGQIAGLTAFQNTRARLGEYLAYITRPAPNAEELPRPAPGPAIESPNTK